MQLLVWKRRRRGLSYKVEEAKNGGIDTRCCLVERFLSDRSIDFEKMQHMMATLWKPGKDVYIKRPEPNLFLFQFYHEFDINRVIEGSSLIYDRMQLVFERLKEGDDPRCAEINKLDFWFHFMTFNLGLCRREYAGIWANI
ncbi:hypothetical protein AgCh_039354 [Apium graveolens]